MGIVELSPSERENATPDESCVLVEANNKNQIASLSPSSSNDRRLSIALVPPVTPDSNRETIKERNLCLNNLLSPLSSGSHINALDETPKDAVFDSFATGPDKLMAAPCRNKYTKQSSVHDVRRCLSFECDADVIRDIGSDDSFNNESSTESEEQSLFELVYAAILDSIASEDNEDILPMLATRVSDSDGFRTPDFVPRVSGVAETCPRAPKKAMNHRRFIYKDICRKLEF